MLSRKNKTLTIAPLMTIFSIVAIALSILPACSSEPPGPVPLLENTTWVLEAYGQPDNLKSVLTGAGYGKDIKITTAFHKFNDTGGQVTGFSGVNTYWGDYKLEDNKISISGIMLTTLGGPQPLMEQESEFIKLLGTAESYRIENSQLQITCGQQILVFVQQQQESKS
jgi:heat shock protein HslJ